MTRSEWEKAFALLMKPVLDYASPGKARVYLPGGQPSYNGPDGDAIEAFVRSLWMAGPWLCANTDGVIDIDGNTVDLAGFYREGILNGTNPDHPESWYTLLSNRSTLIEGAALAWNLQLASNALWQPLSGRERRQVITWLEKVSGITPYYNNWLLFSVVVHTILKLLEGRYNQSVIDSNLDRIESFYLGDGWYNDGPPQRKKGTRLDYYNAWVIHPYLLYWCHIDGDSQPERKLRLIERSRVFLRGYAHFFGADGSFPCFGRSTLYRMAATHVFTWAIQTGACPLPVGQVRRLCNLVLQRFLGLPGVLGQEGQLSMGFTREYLPMIEDYSGPGSPYWAAKAFSVLALPPEHNFWTVPEEPVPVEREDYTLALPGAGFLVHGDCKTGQVQLVNGDSLYMAKKYSNLAYSTYFGYEIDGRKRKEEPDPFGEACLTLSLDGKRWYGRQEGQSLGTANGVLLFRAQHRLGEWGPVVKVISAVTFIGDQQLRLHRVVSRRRIYAREGGFACGWDSGEADLLVKGDVSCVAAEGKASGIRALMGYDAALEPGRSNCNVLHSRSAVPYVSTSKPESGDFYLCSVSLARPAVFQPDEIGGDMDEEVRRIAGILADIDRTGRAGIARVFIFDIAVSSASQVVRIFWLRIIRMIPGRYLVRLSLIMDRIRLRQL